MLSIIFMLILNTTSVNSSAIPFWDCTYAFETNRYPKDNKIYSNNDSIFLLTQYKYDSISAYFELHELLPHRKDYLIRRNDFKKGYMLHDFVITNNYLFVNELLTVFIYKHSADKYIFQDSIIFEKFIEHIEYENGKLYAFSCLHSPEYNKKDSAANLFVLDLKNLNEYREIYFPSPKGMPYTLLQPRKLMDYHNQKVAVGDAIDYRILLYDLDGKLLDSLKRDMECFISDESPEEAENQSRYDLKDNFSKRCMISQVNFINDNTLLISYQAPPSGDVYYDTYHDIWRQKNGNWYLDENDLNWKNTDSAIIFHPMNFGLSSEYNVDDNIISFLETAIPFPLNDNFYNMTMGEFKDSTDWFFPEKSWGFSVNRYKIEVDDEE